MDSATKDFHGVIITGDLDRRPSRAPDYQAENQALTALAEAMSTNPHLMLQRLVEVAMELTRSDSAGISLLEPGGENGTFRWVATAGAWSPYRDGTMPHEVSPCGEVIARDAVLLMKKPERSFPALLQAKPGISEGLLAPFHHGGRPVGTLWTIKHSPDGQFEAEDARILKSLARFAAAAYQTVQALQLAKAVNEHAEIRVQQLVALAEISSEFFGTCDMEFMPIYGNAAAMRMVGLADLDQVKRTPVREFFFPEDLAFITNEFFPRVLRDGQGKVEIRFRHFVTGEPVWVDYSLVVLKDEMGRATGLGTVTHDLTERKGAEKALLESEARQAFLLKLSDALRPMSDPDDVMAAASEALGQHLEVGRAGYGEVDADNEWFVVKRDWTDGVMSSMVGRHRAADFGPESVAAHRSDRTVVVDDALIDARFTGYEAAFRAIQLRASIVVPLVKDGRWIAGFYAQQSSPRRWTEDDERLVRDVVERTWAAVERARAEATLRESEERLQTLMKGIPQMVWRSCSKGLWTWVGPQWLDFTGQTQEESQSMGWLDVIHLADHEATKLAWAEARPHGLLDIEFRVRRATDGGWIWHHTRSVPIRNEQGRIIEWLGTSTDMQVLKEFQKRQGVLVAELQHRTRNLIAIVRSTSDKTADASADLNDFRTRFRGRLDTLARVQGLLSRLNDLDRVTFDELIKAELTAMDSDPDKVTLEGPPGIRLRSSTVQTLAMALHELATNALKYGALGQPDARLSVTWRWEPSGEGGKPWLYIEWRETGVNMAPIGAAPRSTGQGRELIERALPYQLSAKTNYELGPDGVHCTISIPVSSTTGSEEVHD